MPDRKLLVIDGYSLLFRAFHATRFLSTSDGRPTNALFSFTGMLFYALENLRPDGVVVALDAPGKTFRHAEYSEYKGTRSETPPELISQLVAAREFISALGIPTLEVTGFEADDIIGTISKLAEGKGYQTTILTGDLDQLQLVDSAVSVIVPRTGVTDTKVYSPEDVIERFGVEPERLPDWKAIVGDPSDNIPGVPGIGAKGATDLLQKWASVEEILAHLDQVEPKYQKKIDPAKEQLPKSKWLATIVRDVGIEYDFRPFRLTSTEFNAAKAMLDSFEMRNHSRRVGAVLAPYLEGSPESVAATVEEVRETLRAEAADATDWEALAEFVGDREFALLTEFQGAGQGAMFADEASQAWICRGEGVLRAPLAWAMRLFEERPSQVITHDSKQLFRAMPSLGKSPVAFDALLAAYVLQPGRSDYPLRQLIQGYLDCPPPESAEQAAVGLFRLRAEMKDRLEKESQLSVLVSIEQPLAPLLAEMERRGIATSKAVLTEFSAKLGKDIEATTARVYELAGEEFNIGSPKQLGEVLFEKLGLPSDKKTKTGYATGAEVLQNLAPEHAIVREVLSWRELTKLKSTYADALPRMIAEDGRIHTTFNQTVAATGRLSSNDPNLQNIPIRTELGREIRRAFVASEGFDLASFDYSQVELRLLAHMCHDPALVSAFERREDVHTVTASLMFGEPEDAVSKEHRRYAKMLNYAVLYGVTDFGLANQLGGEFSVAEARTLIETYFQRFPSVKAFTESMIAEARAKGFTTTLCGRRRYFPEVHAQNRNERLYAERQAINAPLQGTAADLIKLAMIRAQGLLEGRQTLMLLQVHDELVFELAEGERDLIEPIRSAMESALELSVPIEVDAKLGANWNDMAEVARRP